MPIHLLASAVAIRIQPCRLVEATSEKKAPILQPKVMRGPYPISRPPMTAAASVRHDSLFVGAKRPANPDAIKAPKTIPRSITETVSSRELCLSAYAR